MTQKIMSSYSGAGALRKLHVETYNVANTGIPMMRIAVTDHKNNLLGDIVIGADEMREIIIATLDLIR